MNEKQIEHINKQPLNKYTRQKEKDSTKYVKNLI